LALKVSLPFAPARRGGLIHPRNVVEFEFPPFAPVHPRDVFEFESLPFAQLHPRNVFEFEFLFFPPILSRFHLVQSSRLERGGFVFSHCGLLTLGLGVGRLAVELRLNFLQYFLRPTTLRSRARAFLRQRSPALTNLPQSTNIVACLASLIARP
jgi:hypothetical protein